ncbi:alpha-E domain-containing protein [Raineyella fluvialis]|uniref:Alpha-E domain-containing protein n=1 Tax=Raineyella fluvialis TaxID=2662261 RepID=A0A5Q2F976_9ACTN|nr:alpha-E domain-containing protein [Raineyella fluvialis]QGF23510.1 alpha-E domain-containing protein [Raineyella fluvialis]
MLSRIAQSLFWIGRHVERAEDTARLVQVQLRLFVEEPGVPTHTACSNLLTLLGVPAATYEPLLDEADPQLAHSALVGLLAYDRHQPSSIAYSWEQTRDNARRAREVIPSGVWEVVNTTWQALPRVTPRAIRSQHSYLDWARERSALFYGLARGSMVRDEGWQFLQLGRSLELADMTARLVTATTFAHGAVPWSAALRGCDAHDAFLRSYRGWRASTQAMEFLVQESNFPRSVMHGLTRASDALAAIDGQSSGVGLPGEARYELGRLTHELAYLPADELVDDLAGRMAEVQRTCQRVTTAISQAYFAAAAEQAWTTEETP